MGPNSAPVATASFQYSLARQPGRAPLAFIIPGTGANFDSSKTVILMKTLYKAGLHVVSLASPIHPNFIVSASSSRRPGLLQPDAVDLYHVMELIRRQIGDEIDISGYELAGYSLGATEAAFVAMNPTDGAIRALVGGFQFYRSKFNHATQAWRQPGSAFKPFIYSAALERGFTAATVVPDEPIAIEADVTGSQRWEPKNFDGKFEGPMRLRSALVKSKNMVSIRILDAIGPKYAQDYVTRFGFEPERHPPYLTMALGSGTVTAWQMARAYAVFANGGYLVQPYFIHKIVDDRGNLLGEARPQRAGDESLRVIDTRNAFIMDSLMQDVARVGTAARAASLGRKDVAGKTGTTNEFIDAWFAGYIPSLVGVSWVGLDQPRTLGRNQTGGLVALPIWVGYMQKVQKAVPEMQRIVPQGVVTGDTFELDPSGLGEAKLLPEYFYTEFVPKDDTPPFPLLPVFVPPADESLTTEPPPGADPPPATPAPVTALPPAAR